MKTWLALLQVSVAAVALVLTPACGGSADDKALGLAPGSKTLGADGVSLTIPSEWTGWAYRRTADEITGLRVANYSIPEEDNDIAEAAQASIHREGIVLIVLVGDGPPEQVTKWGSWMPEQLPLEIRRSDLQPLEGFSAPAEGKRAVEVNGRLVLVFAAFGSDVPSDGTLQTLNQVLESLSIESPEQVG